MKKKPTLAQMKKRPALWVSKGGGLYISQPCGAIEAYFYHAKEWGFSLCEHVHLQEDSSVEFVSFI